MSETNRELLLELVDLHVDFRMDKQMLNAVSGVNLKAYKGRNLGIVGESGCGKSVTSQAIIRLIPKNGFISGEILLHEVNGKRLNTPLNLAAMKPNNKEICQIRGRDIAMIFQEPMAAFSPVHTIGAQMIEGLLLHRTKSKEEARKISVDMLRKVGISAPEARFNAYVYQLSGGMRQRAMIAMALANNPVILIADEPTTALDVTIQAQVLELIRNMQQQSGMSVIYITHDLGVIAEMCDDVVVMYLGQVVEYVDVDRLFYHPLHPYTKALLSSIPRLEDKSRARLNTIPGNVPVPVSLPPQCPFHDRCSKCIPGLCDKKRPVLQEIEQGHYVSCFLHGQGGDVHEI